MNKWRDEEVKKWWNEEIKKWRNGSKLRNY